MESEKQQKQIVGEWDVVYVPTKCPLSLIQFPMISQQEFKQFEEHLVAQKCEWFPIQEKLKIDYGVEGNLKNINKKNQNLGDRDIDDEREPPVISYQSRIVHNRNNYFFARKGKTDEGKNIMILHAAANCIQMRPDLNSFQKNNELKNANDIGKELQRQDKEQQREKNTIKKLQEIFSEKDFSQNETKRKQYLSMFERYLQGKQKNYQQFSSLVDQEESDILQFQKFTQNSTLNSNLNPEPNQDNIQNLIPNSIERLREQYDGK